MARSTVRASSCGRGCTNARQAVGALRGEPLPGAAELEALVSGFRNDLGLDVTLSVEGSPRPLTAEASLAFYRGAQEALTNIARYAPAPRPPSFSAMTPSVRA